MVSQSASAETSRRSEASTETCGHAAAIAELAGQARDIARRHPWLAALLHRPMPPGPNGLRYLDYFLGLLAGSRLGTGAKLEVIAMISGSPPCTARCKLPPSAS